MVDGTTKVGGSINILRYLGDKFGEVTVLYSYLSYDLLLSTGMTDKDEIGNALLGGSSDYLVDLASHLTTMFFASNEEKVSMHACI